MITLTTDDGENRQSFRCQDSNDSKIFYTSVLLLLSLSFTPTFIFIRKF